MKHKEILTKAIEKAIAGGWLKKIFEDASEWKVINSYPRMFLSIHQENPRAFDDYIETKFYVTEIIFDHWFAKALWSTHNHYSMGNMRSDGKGIYGHINHLVDWQYHLQRMVIAEDPVAYLGENLD